MIESTIVDGIHKIKVINDTTRQCEFALDIPEKAFGKLAKISAEIYKEALKVESENTLLANVPKSIRGNILKILESTDELSAKYFSHADPMLKSLIEITKRETIIINKCKIFWDALNADNVKFAIEEYKAIHKSLIDLRNFKNSNENHSYNLTPLTDRFKLRLQQLNGQISKVDLNLSGAAHEHYSRLCKTIELEFDVCLSYQSQITSWDEMRDKLLTEAHAEFEKIEKIMVGKIKSVSLPAELKNNEAAAVTPTKSYINDGSQYLENQPGLKVSNFKDDHDGHSLSRVASETSPHVATDSPSHLPQTVVSISGSKLALSSSPIYNKKEKPPIQQRQIASLPDDDKPADVGCFCGFGKKKR
jgi:hypothetical protein